MRELLKKQLDYTPLNKMTIDEAVKFVCPYTMEQLKSKNRKWELLFWRQALQSCYYMQGMTYEHVGDIFGQDHSTVVHVVKKVLGEIDTNQEEIVGKIRLILYYAKKAQVVYQEMIDKRFCNQVQFKIQVA